MTVSLNTALGARHLVESGNSYGSTDPVVHTGDLNETVIASFTHLFSAPSKMQITLLWEVTNNSNTKAIRARLGSVSGPIIHSGSLSTHVAALQLGTSFITQDGLRGYVAWAPGAGTGALVDLSIDWRTPQTIVITADLADVGDVMTLQSWGAAITPVT